MNNRFYVYALTIIALVFGGSASAAETFKFHSSQEPAAVDPLMLTEATGGFLFYNLYRGLYRVSGDGVLVPELASSCAWQDRKKTTMLCRLRPGARFSDGTAIKAEHFVFAWHRLVAPGSGTRHAELLAHVKGFADVISGRKPVSALGISAKGERAIEIRFEKPDPEFIYKLASPILTPLLKPPPVDPDEFTKAVTTGPYRIKSWSRKTRIELEPNPYYFRKASRPAAEVLLISEDATALQMFDLGKLSLLRRLTVKEIASRKSKPGFLYIPTFRFDYVGFGPDLEPYPQLRKALALALNYPELTAAYETPGKIGCPSLPKRLAQPYPCHRFSLALAQEALADVPDEIKKKTWTLAFSKAGGEDIARGMEWMQAQWKKHLDLNVELKVVENSMYLKTLATNPPALFRKGLNLDRPTCTAALENFASESPENLIRFKSAEYDKLVAELAAETREQRKAVLCGRALRLLIDGYRLIPLGEIHFAMLAANGFENYRITPLNQLDLTGLRLNRGK
jgi:oligopeptide transport system substrate-binding protein